MHIPGTQYIIVNYYNKKDDVMAEQKSKKTATIWEITIYKMTAINKPANGHKENMAAAKL